MMRAGNSSRGYKAKSRPDGPPPLMSRTDYNLHNTRPHYPPGPGNAHFERQRSPCDYARDGPHSDYRAGRNYMRLDFNDPGPTTEYVMAVRNNRTNMTLNVHRGSPDWQQPSYDHVGRSPRYFEQEDSSYPRNYHPHRNSARPPSPASVQEYDYRRNKSYNSRDRTFRGHMARTRSTGPSMSHRDQSCNRPYFNVNDEYHCPTCGRFFGAQIYKCNNEHGSCVKCMQHSRPCGICGHNITSQRNVTLERNIAERKIPCPHKADGCLLFVKIMEMESHIAECPFQKLSCPVGCYWKGRLKELSAHFDSFHPEQRSVDVASEIRLRDIYNNSQNVYLMLIGAYSFLFHVKVSEDDRRIYMAVQLIGTKLSSSKWSYEVQVYNKNESRRKYIFTDVCTSFVEPVADLFMKGKCSVLQCSYALTFFNNGYLAYKIFIKKNIDENPRKDCGKNYKRRDASAC